MYLFAYLILCHYLNILFITFSYLCSRCISHKARYFPTFRPFFKTLRCKRWNSTLLLTRALGVENTSFHWVRIEPTTVCNHNKCRNYSLAINTETIENKQNITWGQSWRRGTCDCKIDWLWIRSPLEEMKYLFTFLRSGVKAKRGVEFRHSTRNALRTRQKVGSGSVLKRGFLCLPCSLWNTAWS